MNRTQITRLLESKNLTLEDVSTMSSRTRVSIGLPAIIPQTDYNGFQLMMDSILPKFVGLRKMFGLDSEIVTDPVYNIGDNGGRASQFYQNSILFNQQRGPVYTLVEEMDTYDLIHSALDLYAEEATQQDPDTQHVVWVESEDGNLEAELSDLLSRLSLDDKAFSIIRTMCKYGDDFERIITADNIGVTATSFVHPARLSRIEDHEGRLQGFAAGILAPEDCVWETIKEKQKVSYPWDFVHFRLQSTNRDSKHGDSILLGSRRAYQQLKMTEDMLVLYRLARSFDRDVYYVNTNGATATQAWRTINDFRQEVRKKLAISPGASMRQEFNPRTPDEDLFLPVMGKEDPTRVERQTGGAPQGDINDVDHFRRKLFGSLRIPAGFMGFEEDVNAKATLASQDVRFARSIKRIQRAFKQGIRWLCEVHMIKKGMDTRDELGRMLMKFAVKMSPINQLEEQAKVEIYQARIQLVSQMLTLVGIQQQADPQTGLILPATGVIPNIQAWVAWVLRKFLALTDSEVAMFLGGDPTLGLTPDSIEMHRMTELAESNGLMTKIANSTKTLKEAIEVLRDDDCFEVVVPKSKLERGSAVQSGAFDVAVEEQSVRERLNHSGDGYVMQCPVCRDNSLSMRFDKSRNQSYMFCRCGHTAYLGEE